MLVIGAVRLVRPACSLWCRAACSPSSFLSALFRGDSSEKYRSPNIGESNLGMILFVLCTWFLSYNIAIRISDLIYVVRDEADYLNYVPPNSGSVYTIADLSEAALSTDYAALFYIAQTMLLDYLADLFVYDFQNCR
jgi:hypothetical protein